MVKCETESGYVDRYPIEQTDDEFMPTESVEYVMIVGAN
jgi:hypothetical protein